MKNRIITLVFAILTWPLLTVNGAITLTYQSGAMEQFGGGQIAAGSMGILVADILNEGFATPETIIGSSLAAGGTLGSTGNLILHTFEAFDISSGGDIMGFSDTFNVNYTGGMQEGVALGFYWFPTIFDSSTIISDGLTYGFYTSDIYDPLNGGDISFVAPADLGVYNLFVFDNITNPASSTLPIELTASNVAIPEPSTYALLGLGLGALYWLRRQQRKTATQTAG